MTYAVVTRVGMFLIILIIFLSRLIATQGAGR